jgi:hypothetical protein
VLPPSPTGSSATLASALQMQKTNEDFVSSAAANCARLHAVAVIGVSGNRQRHHAPTAAVAADRHAEIANCSRAAEQQQQPNACAAAVATDQLRISPLACGRQSNCNSPAQLLTVAAPASTPLKHRRICCLHTLHHGHACSVAHVQ